MKRKKKTVIAAAFFAGMVLLFILRYLLTQRMGLFFVPDSGVDDILLLRYSDITAHYQYPDAYSLAKNMPFSLILHFCETNGIRYSSVMTASWGLAALTAAGVAYVFTKSIPVSGVFYALTLFSPFGFERASARVYRLGILPPLVVILFGIMILCSYCLVNKKEHAAGFVILNLLAGIIGTFTAYIKEDGIWIVCCMAFSCLVNVLLILYGLIRLKKHTVRSWILLAAALVPLFVYAGSTVHYKNVNERVFGVRLVNNRTEGEMAEFINRLYLTDSRERTGALWAPQDAVEQVISVSPTLSANETVTRALRTGSVYGLPIEGDFMGWVLLCAIDELEWDTDYKGVQDWFGQVNAEIDAAFADGRLKKEDRFQLLPSTGGKTGKEVAGVLGSTFRTIGTSLWLDVYYTGDYTVLYDETNQEWLEMMDDVTGDGALFRVNADSAKKARTHRLIGHIFTLYRGVNTFMLVMSAAAFVYLTAGLPGKKARTARNLFLAAVMLVMTGIMFVYAFGISWFCSFLDRSAIAGYGGPVYSMLTYVFVCGAAVFCGNRKEGKRPFGKRKKSESERKKEA